MHEFKVVFRVDEEEYFCTDDFIVKADSLFEAAEKADKDIDQRLKGTLWSIERLA